MGDVIRGVFHDDESKDARALRVEQELKLFRLQMRRLAHVGTTLDEVATVVLEEIGQWWPPGLGGEPSC